MATNDAWLAQVQEDAIEPELPICDPHHHLWGKRDGTVEPVYLLDELTADLGSGHNIVSTVFIEAKAMYRADGPEELRPVGEIEFINGLAAAAASGAYGKTKACAAIIGATPLTRGKAAGDVLDAMIAAAPNRFRGIRDSAAWDADPVVRGTRARPSDLLTNPAYIDGVREIARRGLIFEAWCFHPQIPQLTALARAVPEVTIILDHIGGVIGVGDAYAGKRAAVMEDWKRAMKDLAACPNVAVKLGGIGMEVAGWGWHERPKPPTSDEIAEAARPYYSFVIDNFGPDRALFESNFPVEKKAVSYSVLWNAFKKVARDYSAAEKAKLFHDNAARLYRLEA